MAYTFQKVDEMLGDQQGKTDIFGQQAGGQQAQPNQMGIAAPGGEKTSTEGEISSGGSAGGQSSARGQAPSQAAVSIAKVQGAKAKVPEFMTRAQGDIGQATQNLQNEANQYMQGAQAKRYNVGQDVLQGAIGGNQEAYGQLATRLGQKAPDQYEAFQPKTQTSFQDVNALQSAQGTKQLLGRAGGGQYSQGEGALDLAIMKRNPQFNLLREQLLSGQRGLQGQAAKLQEEQTSAAQAAQQANYAADTSDIQQRLGAGASELQKAAQQRAQAAQAQRAQEEAGRNEFIRQQTQAAQQELRGQQTDPRLQAIYKNDLTAFGRDNEKYSDAENLADMQKYYNPGAAIGSEMYQEPEAQSFNRIQSLLGRGDRASASNAGQGRSFNKQALQDYINQQAQSQLGYQTKQGGEELRGLTEKINRAYAVPTMADVAGGPGSLYAPDTNLVAQLQASAARSGQQIDPVLLERAKNYAAQYAKLNAPAPGTPAPYYEPGSRQSAPNKYGSPVMLPLPTTPHRLERAGQFSDEAAKYDPTNKKNW